LKTKVAFTSKIPKDNTIILKLKNLKKLLFIYFSKKDISQLNKINLITEHGFIMIKTIHLYDISSA